MSDATRRRLVQLVRRPDADLAEAALLVAAEAAPAASGDAPTDVDGSLLRIDALADALRTCGFTPTGDADTDGAALALALGRERGFHGHGPDDRKPDDALLDRVLDRRRGLPITLSILYVALGRRLDVRAFPIALPGHVVVGVTSRPGRTSIGGDDRPVVLDPFHGGVPLDEQAVAQRVSAATGGQLAFRRAMLRPAAPADLIRRLLNNLTHDYTVLGHLRDALWTVEVKQLLPVRLPDDDRVRGRLLEQLGRFDQAADAFETYVETVGDQAPDVTEVRRDAIRCRARLN
jgi:regulator of sirC expression with transglutaminase-like and TPR domain